MRQGSHYRHTIPLAGARPCNGAHLVKQSRGWRQGRTARLRRQKVARVRGGLRQRGSSRGGRPPGRAARRPRPRRSQAPRRKGSWQRGSSRGGRPPGRAARRMPLQAGLFVGCTALDIRKAARFAPAFFKTVVAIGGLAGRMSRDRVMTASLHLDAGRVALGQAPRNGERLRCGGALFIRRRVGEGDSTRASLPSIAHALFRAWPLGSLQNSIIWPRLNCRRTPRLSVLEWARPETLPGRPECPCKVLSFRA